MNFRTLHARKEREKNASRSFVQRFHYVCILFREQTLERHWRTGANIYSSMKKGCANHSNGKYFHIQIYMNFFHHFVRQTIASYTSFGVRFCFDLSVFISISLSYHLDTRFGKTCLTSALEKVNINHEHPAGTSCEWTYQWQKKAKDLQVKWYPHIYRCM